MTWSNYSFAVGLVLGSALIGTIAGVYILDLRARLHGARRWVKPIDP